MKKNWISLVALVVALSVVGAPALAGIVRKFRGQVVMPASGLIYEGTTVAASGAELNAAADVSARLVDVGDANYTVLVANSGKPHVVADVSADRTFTLPAEASGLEYEFIADVVAADGHDWIFDTGANANFFTGGLLFADTDAGSAGIEVVVAAGDGNSNSKLQINVPAPGTRIKFVCDGTTWTLSGLVVSTTAPTFADQ